MKGGGFFSRRMTTCFSRRTYFPPVIFAVYTAAVSA